MNRGDRSQGHGAPEQGGSEHLIVAKPQGGDKLTRKGIDEGVSKTKSKAQAFSPWQKVGAWQGSSRELRET